jgi:hypothetical protein
MPARGQPHDEEGDAMRRVLMAAAAIAVAAAAPAGAKLSKQAYIRVDVLAYQHVEWSNHATVTGCSNSVLSVDAQGTGDVIARDQEGPWAVARRTGTRATLLVHSEGAAFAAAGTVSRDGSVNATYTKPPDDPRACQKPEPAQSDCGTQLLPQGALMYLSYTKPRLTLSGPYVQEWGGMPFKFCPGANGDDTLAGTWYQPGATTSAVLPLTKLFGNAKRFTVEYRNERTVQTARPGGAVLSEDHPVATTIHWTVKFTRLAHPQLVAPPD